MDNRFLLKVFDMDVDGRFCSDFQVGKSATDIHWHSGMEIIYMQKGESNVFFDERWHVLSENSLLFIPAGRLHCCRCVDETAQKIVVGFTEKCFGNNITVKALPVGVEKFCIVPNLSASKIPALLKKLHEHCEIKSYSSELKVIACIMEIFAELLDYWTSVGLAVAYGKDKKMEGEIAEYIQKHCTEDISPYTVAKELSVSYSALAKKLKSALGMGFTKAVNLARVEIAKKLLATTDKNVTEISLECGFYDVSYFIKTFRLYTGATPKSFRNLTK